MPFDPIGCADTNMLSLAVVAGEGRIADKGWHAREHGELLLIWIQACLDRQGYMACTMYYVSSGRNA